MTPYTFLNKSELTDRNINIENQIEIINSHILFINETLSKVEAELDEDQMIWNREISNDNSKTSKYVEEQLEAVIMY